MAIALGSRIGPYEVVSLLGAGGMGEVYRARDTRLERDVAIKILPPVFAADPDRRRRFEREARAIAALNHPHICQIFDVGPDYLVLEYIEGIPLAGPLSPDIALRVALQVAGALQAAHAAGLLHRDLKPANILLTRAGDAKLLDFGLATLLCSADAADDITRTTDGAIVDTAAYMPPEQAEGRPVDARADVFSFGAVLCELITGKRAFPGRTPVQVLSAVMHDAPRLPGPSPLTRIVSRCLEKDPAHRYQTMAEVRAALEDVERDPSIGSVLPEKPGRVGPGNRMIASAAAALVVLGGLGAWFGGIVPPTDADGERRIESIVVLPLENLSHDAAQDYFADGMTEELMTELARIRSLRVISRTSALRYKGSAKSLREIGGELNVDAVVEGSVLRAGQQTRITVKLVDVATDRTLLAESYARELQDILGLQSEIARAVADQIRATTTPGEQLRVSRRVNPDAYDDYLRGRASWWKRTPEGIKEALALFERAIERDPTYAAAWAGIADCYIVFSGALLGLSGKEAYPKAREAITRALALDETLAEAHASLGSVKSEYDWDFVGAEAEYTRAIALNASYVTARQWYGEFLYFRGRHEEAVAQLRHASNVDPLSPVVNNSLAIALLLSGRYSEAIEQVEKILKIDPTYGPAYGTLGMVYLQQGLHADAIGPLQRSITLSPGLGRPLALLGYAYGTASKLENARQVIGQLQALSKRIPVSPYDVALVYAGLGDTDRSFEWLEKAYGERAWDLMQLENDTRFARLRGDRRFNDLIGRIDVRRDDERR